MVKLISLFRRPPNDAEFINHVHNVHMPLVGKYPGLRRSEVTRITGAPLGDIRFFLMAEFYFDDKDAMDAALASPEGKAVARDLMSFAAQAVTVFFTVRVS